MYNKRLILFNLYQTDLIVAVLSPDVAKGAIAVQSVTPEAINQGVI